VVLRGCPDHRRSADVDLLDELVERDVGSLRGSGEWIEVHDDDLERRDPGLDQRFSMFRIPSVGQNPCVDARVKRLDPAVEHLGEAGHRRDVRHGKVPVAQGSGRSAGRDELETEADEASAEFGEAGLVGDGQQRSPGGRDIRIGPARVQDDSPTGLTPGERAREEEAGRAWQQAVLDRANALVERRLRVAGDDRDGFLGDDRPAVERLVDEVHGHARHGRPMSERIADGVCARKRRQQ
jgi:hypothetical protein